VVNSRVAERAPEAEDRGACAEGVGAREGVSPSRVKLGGLVLRKQASFYGSTHTLWKQVLGLRKEACLLRKQACFMEGSDVAAEASTLCGIAEL